MSALTEELAGVALELIATEGRAVTLRSGGNTFNPVTGAMSGAVIDTETLAVEDSFKAHQVDGSVIQAGDKKFLIAASGLAVEPDTSYQIIDGAETYQVVHVMPVKPGTVTVLYEMQARR